MLLTFCKVPSWRLQKCSMLVVSASLPAGQLDPLLRSALRKVTRQAAVHGIHL